MVGSGAARERRSNPNVRFGSSSPLGWRRWWSNLSQGAAVRSGDYLWVSASCPLLFPDSIRELVLLTLDMLWSFLLFLSCLSRLARETESVLKGGIQAGRTHQRWGGPSEFWKEQALALERVQTLRVHWAVLFSLDNCHLQPPALSPTLEPPDYLQHLSGDPQRAEVRWSDKQEVRWNFIPGKKKKRTLA